MSGGLITFVLIAYNQEKFIREAIEGAFSQTYSPLEIVISDDCSTDSTFRIISEMVSSYNGSHTIVLNRNERNIGIAGNLNRAFELSSGAFLVIAAGDDISLPQRTERLVECWDSAKTSASDLVASYFEEIDERGNRTGKIVKHNALFKNVEQQVHKWKCETVGACNGYSRKLYDKYGALDKGIIGEDWIYFFRAWLEGGIATVEEPLVLRRIHAESIMSVHASINKKDKDTRRRLRKLGHRAEAARAKQWLKDYFISKNTLDYDRTAEFKQWIELMELEELADERSRFWAVAIAARILCQFGDMRRAIRIMIRSVLRVS